MLKTILKPWIKKDSIIYINKWKAYKKIYEELEFLEHRTVCHRDWFLDPDTGVHTQEIKSCWNVLNKLVRKRGYSMRPADNLLSYSGEFLWRRKEAFKIFILLQKTFL